MKRTSLLLALLLAACTPKVHNAVSSDALPAIYPDYVGVTIPAGIAPLDFQLEGADALDVRLTAPDGTELRSNGEAYTCFPEKKWAKLLEKSVGDSLQVSVSGLKGDKWTTYRSFGIFVSPDAIDYGLTYRMLEPGYEIYSHMGI